MSSVKPLDMSDSSSIKDNLLIMNQWDSSLNLYLLSKKDQNFSKKLINYKFIVTSNKNNDNNDENLFSIGLNVNFYIDLLVSFFMLSVDDLKDNNNSLKNKNVGSKNLKYQNENEILSFNDRNNLNDFSLDILITISNNFHLNCLMKEVLELYNPKYYTFIITFILMDSFTQRREGHMYLENINKVFLSCFYIACYFFEDNDEYFDDLLHNNHIQTKLVDKKCLTEIQCILILKSYKDFMEYKILFENLYNSNVSFNNKYK